LDAFVELPQPTDTTTDTQTPGGERQFGRKAQLSNITAAKTVADIIRSCLGPKAMLKMLLDPMGGIVLTNDGHAILREIEVAHPAAKSMIELSRTQDEEVGDGTTTVIILGTRRDKRTGAMADNPSWRDARASSAATRT
jgi:hypothetical protein